MFQERYKRFWENKYVKHGDKLLKIVEVNYIGNSVYGGVMYRTEDGSEHVVHHRGYKPKQSDLSVFWETGQKIRKRYAGSSSDGRTNKWSMECVCGKIHKPNTIMLRFQGIICPKCGSEEKIDLNS